MAGDPVSWLLIEPGWTVYDAAGEKFGKVKEVLADEQADIFHGVLVADEEIVAERIAEIREGDLHLCRLPGRAGNVRLCRTGSTTTRGRRASGPQPPPAKRAGHPRRRRASRGAVAK